MTREEIKKEAEKYIENIAPYWFKAESEDRESSIEEFTNFAESILIKTGNLTKKCYCGKPVDTSNPDCVDFNLCKEHADDV